MFPSFLVKTLCYACRPFTNKFESDPESADDASLLVRGLHV